MTDVPPAPETKRAPTTVSGRVFVPIFVAALAVGATVAIVLLLRVRPVAETARLRTFPLSAKLNARCRSSGPPLPADLHVSPRCPASGSLILSAAETGEAAKHVGYAIVGDDASEQPLVGDYEIGKEGTVPLATRSVGAHTIVFFISEKPVDLTEMKHALSLARPGDMGDALLRLEQFRSVMRHQQIDSKVDRIKFKVEGG